MSQTNDIRQIRIQSRVDTPENWTRENPILLEREIGYETNGKYKIGKIQNGQLLSWNELEYANPEENIDLNLNIENGEGDKSLQQKGNTAIGSFSHAEGYDTKAEETASHAEGWGTLASGRSSHAEGDGTVAGNDISHAEGSGTEALNSCAHTEGRGTYAGIMGCAYSSIDYTNNIIYASGLQSIDVNTEPILYQPGDVISLEGYYNNEIYLDCATIINIEGNKVYVDSINIPEQQSSELMRAPTPVPIPPERVENPIFFVRKKLNVGYLRLHLDPLKLYDGDLSIFHESSHAEGRYSIASGTASHAEGEFTRALGVDSHAEGNKTQSLADYTHSEGVETIANGWAQHVQGKYNIPDTTSAFIIGNGEDEYNEETGELIQQNRSNAMTVDWDGNAWFAGDIKIGGTKYSEGTTLATVNYVDNANLSKSICYYTNIHPEDWTTYNDGQNTYYQCVITWFAIDEPGSINWNTPLNIDNNSAFIVDFVKINESYTKTKERKQQYLDYIANGIVEIQDNQLIITIFGDRPTIDYIPIMIKEI